MALRVWLPLNGDINNYGISDITFTNTSTSNTTNSASGKTGSCYTNNSNTVGGLLSNQTINLGLKQSMCCWVKFNSFYSAASLTGIGGQHRYYDKAPSNMGLTAKYLSATTGKLSVNTAVGTSRTYNTYCGNTTLNSGTWYHVAYTYDGTTISLYVNGILDGTFNIPNMVVKADYIHLFSWSSSGASDKAIHSDYKLNGSLNDFRVYDHCLSPKEVKEISKGLCLHYKLDGVCNTIDSTEWDCSGFGNNGTKNGSITVSNDTGRYSSSYKFGTTSSKIKLPAFSYSGLANSYSFSWWQKNTGSGNMPWGFSDGNRLNLYHTTNLCWNTGDGGGNPFKDSSGTAIPNTRLCDSTWHHCVVTGNGSTTKLYIDGIYAGAATTYKAITGTQIYISGWDTSTSYTFSGSNLSDFRIYATVLSDADIKELYNTPLSIDNVGNMYTYEFKEIE